VLPGQDSEECLAVDRVMVLRTETDHSEDIVDAGRPDAGFVSDPDLGQFGLPAGAQGLGRPDYLRLGSPGGEGGHLGGPGRVETSFGQRFLDVTPALGEGPQHLLRDPRYLAQAAAGHVPGNA
jgi:hypothetical protein